MRVVGKDMHAQSPQTLYVCAHVHACGGQRILGVFLYHFLPNSLDAGSVTELEVPLFCLGWMAGEIL